MADEVDALAPGGLDESEDVVDELVEAVGVPVGRAGRGAVAALVRGEGAQARLVQSGGDAVPARAVGREAVEEHDDLTTQRTSVGHVEAQPVPAEGRDPLVEGSHAPIVPRRAEERPTGCPGQGLHLGAKPEAA